jgi:hypothetical protein
LFVQQSVENNLLLGATSIAERTRVPRMLEPVYGVFRRLAERAARQKKVKLKEGARSARRNVANSQGPCRAVSGRCWPLAAA